VTRTTAEPASRARAASSARPVLSVVVPVYNGGPTIVENVELIRERAGGELAPEELELVVVSDGSIDGTAERLLAARSDVAMRVIHYDRNLGKGYAVKVGSLAARGSWLALVDADLDLDPGAIPGYLRKARDEELDLVVGSKRHPDSVVDYPRSRRVASWCYQQLNRVLFDLNVRDTQVGLKVFRHEVAEEVVPLLLVKQFAFDLELLAVASALGFRRIAECPIRLEYRFTGSGVRSRAVARALLDTAAVFYRLRILRTYQRKRQLLRGPRSDEEPLVSLLGAPQQAATLDYPRLEVLGATDSRAAAAAQGELVAVLAPDARPAGNWLSVAVPYFAHEDVAAVVVPEVAPTQSTLRERVAAAVLESHLGGGSRRSRSFPGNVRETDDYPTANVVARREDYVAAEAAGVADAELVSWLAERGRRTVYAPDAVVAVAPAPVFGAHLRETLRHARARGGAAVRTRGRSVSSATTLSLLPAASAAAGVLLVVLGSGRTARAGGGLVAVYGLVVASSALLSALRFRSLTVGLLAAPALVLTQATYVAGFVRGLLARR
jgi:glycosyltransferase involved in cell wall biosynthesis